LSIFRYGAPFIVCRLSLPKVLYCLSIFVTEGPLLLSISLPRGCRAFCFTCDNVFGLVFLMATLLFVRLRKVLYCCRFLLRRPFLSLSIFVTAPLYCRRFLLRRPFYCCRFLLRGGLYCCRFFVTAPLYRLSIFVTTPPLLLSISFTASLLFHLFSREKDAITPADFNFDGFQYTRKNINLKSVSYDSPIFRTNYPVISGVLKIERS